MKAVQLLFSLSITGLMGIGVHSPGLAQELQRQQMIAQAVDESQTISQGQLQSIVNSYWSWLEQQSFLSIEEDYMEKSSAVVNTYDGQNSSVRIIGLLLESYDTEILSDKLDQWVNATGSDLAHAVRGMHYYNQAADARGTSFLSNTPRSQVEDFQRLLDLSRIDIQTSLSRNPNNPIALLTALDIGRNLGLPLEQYDSLFSRLIAQDPYMVNAHMRRLTRLAPQWGGDTELLFSYARALYENAPEDSAVVFALAHAHSLVCHLEGSRQRYYQNPAVWDEVRSSYLAVMELLPTVPHFPANLGEIALLTERYDVAFEVYSRAHQLQPNNADYQLSLATAAFHTNNLNTADEVLTEYTSTNQTNGRAYYYHGRVQNMQSQHQLAVSSYSRALELEPEMAIAYMERGYAKAALDDQSGAIQDMSRGIELFEAQGDAASISHYRRFLEALQNGDWSPNQ